MSRSKEIVRRAFLEEEDMDEEFMKEIVSDFKTFNYKLKCLGIYKSGVKKGW